MEEQIERSELFRRLPQQSLRFIVSSVVPISIINLTYLLILSGPRFWVIFFSVCFLLNILLVLTLLRGRVPLELVIFLNLVIFSGAGYFAAADAPYWLLFMAPIVPIALTVHNAVIKYALLVMTLLCCVSVGYLKGFTAINILTNSLALCILAVFAVRISQFLRNQQAVIAREREIADELLENVFPVSIARRMKSGEVNIVDGFDRVAILFADIVGFTRFSEKHTPEELVQVLNRIFSLIDHLSEKNHLEKIKTIGDAYMVASGLPRSHEDYLENMANFALALRTEFAALSEANGFDLNVRIGVHSGKVVAGVIGQKKFSYDVWGDVVNTASRMESHGEPGLVHCSETVYELPKEKFDFEARGVQEIKGKGKMNTYFLVGESAS